MNSPVYGAGNRLESTAVLSHPLISWRSIVAGLLVAFFSEAILLALGLAIGGFSISSAINPSSATQIGMMSGAWFFITAVISLLIGSYFAGRVSRLCTTQIGAAQGLVIAGLFFGFFIWQLLNTVGWAGRTITTAFGTTAYMIGNNMDALASNDQVQSLVEDVANEFRLRSPVEVVSRNVASRLVRGDTQGAKLYLARQSGMSVAEVDQRVDALNNQIQSYLTRARDTAARALSTGGLTLFLVHLFGALAAMAGGALGAAQNFKRPLAREESTMAAAAAAAATLSPSPSLS